MENVNLTPYSPPKLEIITLERNDIVTASDGGGYEPDDNTLYEW